MQIPGRTSIPNGGVGGGTAYTDAQVLTALATSGPETWIFDRLDGSGRYLGDLTSFVAEGTVATVVHDSTAAVKRRLTIRMIGSAPLTPLSDQIGVRYWRGAADGGWLEFQLGKFLSNQPTRTVSRGVTWLDFNAPDYGQLLVDAPFLSSIGLAAGTSYLTGVRQFFQYGGAMPIVSLIPDLIKTLPSALGWTVDYSRLAAINELLKTINYGSLWFDERGQARADPIPDYRQAAATATFDTTAGAGIMDWQETPDLALAFNICNVIGEDPQRVPVYGRFTNDSPASRVSTVKWHPVVRQIRDTKIPDVATAQVRARIECQAAARVFSELLVPSLPWPLSQERDLYGLIYTTADEGAVAGTYLELGWTHRCATGQHTDHRLTRVEA